MKKVSFYVLMFLVNTIALTATAQSKNEEFGFIEITGSALLNDVKTKNYAVSVYLDGRIIDSMYTATKRPVTYTLEYNQVYTFLFQKEGCEDKVVIVNTKIPEGLKGMQDNTFEFQVEMSETLTKKSKETEDYPVAVLMINKKDELLEISEDYYKLTHKEEDVTTSNRLEAPKSAVKK